MPVLDKLFFVSLALSIISGVVACRAYSVYHTATLLMMPYIFLLISCCIFVGIIFKD